MCPWHNANPHWFLRGMGLAIGLVITFENMVKSDSGKKNGGSAKSHYFWFHALNLGPLAWFVADAILAYLVMILSFHLSPSYVIDDQNSFFKAHITPELASLFYALITAITSHIVGLPLRRSRKELWVVMLRTIGCVLIAQTILQLFVNVVLYRHLGRIIVLISAVLSFGAMSLLRLFILEMTSTTRIPVIMLGAGDIGRRFIGLFSNNELSYVPVACIDINPELDGKEIDGVPIIVNKKNILACCQELGAH